MQIQILNKSKDSNKMSFLIKGVNHSYVNALRRLMSSEVPTIAIDEVTFTKNESILYDEMVAHRLGLIPLKTDSSMDEKTQVTFTLKSKGPGYVYASELKSSDNKCKPVYPKTPIVKLAEKQEIHFEATARIGKGIEHMKWSPGTMFYIEEPKITINNKHKDFASFKDHFPPEAFNSKGELDEKKIVQNNLTDACAGVNQEIFSVKYSDDNFIMNVESWGQMPCEDIVKSAIDVFDAQLTQLSKLLKAK